MTNFVMHIQYDGSRYKGWQRLGGEDAGKTIQGKIEMVLEKLFDQPVEINGASRTDAGVHCLHQVANFQIETELNSKAVHEYLLEYLPEDISVVSVKVGHPKFHARFSAKSKTYEYRIFNDKVLNPFQRKYVTHLFVQLDLDKMREAAEVLIGEHDFTAFTNAKSKKNSMVRTIYSLKIERKGPMILIQIKADGFLHNMVRKIVANLIEVGKGNMTAEKLRNILNKQDRALSAGTAPAEGLFLKEIEYDTEKK